MWCCGQSTGTMKWHQVLCWLCVLYKHYITRQTGSTHRFLLQQYGGNPPVLWHTSMPSGHSMDSLLSTLAFCGFKISVILAKAESFSWRSFSNFWMRRRAASSFASASASDFMMSAISGVRRIAKGVTNIAMTMKTTGRAIVGVVLVGELHRNH